MNPRPAPSCTRPLAGSRSAVRGTTFAALVGVLAGTLLPGCSSEEAEQPERGKPLVAMVAPIEWQPSYELQRDYLGQVEPVREVAAAFELAGRIESIAFEEGDSVRAGQQIAQLETSRLNAERASLDARRLAAEALLAELVKGPRAEAIAAARAEVARLKAERELASITTGRQTRLSDRGAASGQRADEARLAAESAAAALQAAAARLEELETGTRQEKIDAQRASVKQLEADIAQIDVQIGKSSLAAPFAASVAARMVDEGATVSPGQTVLRLMEQDHWQLRVGVPADAADSLEIGQTFTAKVRDESLQVKLVRRRRDRHDATRTVPLLFEFTPESSSANFYDGDLARVSLGRTVEQRGFWLPIEALVEGMRGLWACYIAVPIADSESAGNATHELKRVQLELLHNDEKRAFVRGPVDSQAMVVTAGTHRLVPKQYVTLKRQAPEAEPSADPSGPDAPSGDPSDDT